MIKVSTGLVSNNFDYSSFNQKMTLVSKPLSFFQLIEPCKENKENEYTPATKAMMGVAAGVFTVGLGFAAYKNWDEVTKPLFKLMNCFNPEISPVIIPKTPAEIAMETIMTGFEYTKTGLEYTKAGLELTWGSLVSIADFNKTYIKPVGDVLFGTRISRYIRVSGLLATKAIFPNFMSGRVKDPFPIGDQIISAVFNTMKKEILKKIIWRF